jgi:hypothetical protein
MATFTKKELQKQINNIDTRIALLKLPTVAIEDGEWVETELQRLNAARNELLEKMKVAMQMNALPSALSRHGPAGTLAAAT